MLLCTEVTLVDGLTVRLVSSDSGLRAIEFEPWSPVQGSHPGAHRISSEAVRQLRAYFGGQLRRTADRTLSLVWHVSGAVAESHSQCASRVDLKGKNDVS